jgi:RNA polymerase sigma-70 factor (ECF subfamily)
MSSPNVSQDVPLAQGDDSIAARIGPGMTAPGSGSVVAAPSTLSFTGRAERFGRVVADHEAKLLRYIGGLIGDRDAAQDVVQEVFLKLHQQIAKNGWDSIEHLPTWLSRVAHNQAIDIARKKHREKEVIKESTQEQPPAEATQGDPGEAAGEGSLEDREMQGIAVEELRKLPPDLREPLLLKVYQGLTVRQIAQVTGMSNTMVFNRTAEALKTLAQRMKERGATGE